MTQFEMTAMAGSAMLTGVTTFAMQQASPVDTLPILTPLVSACVGGGVTYGIMRATIHSLQIEIRDLKRDLIEIRRTGTDALVRVSAIEGQLRHIQGTHE